MDLIIGPVFSNKIIEINNRVKSINIPILSFSNNKKFIHVSYSNSNSQSPRTEFVYKHGLVEIDKKDFSRKPHNSAYWFGNISKTNNLSI